MVGIKNYSGICIKKDRLRFIKRNFMLIKIRL